MLVLAFAFRCPFGHVVQTLSFLLKFPYEQTKSKQSTRAHRVCLFINAQNTGNVTSKTILPWPLLQQTAKQWKAWPYWGEGGSLHGHIPTISAPETDWNKPFSAWYQCGLSNTRKAAVVVATLYSPSPRGSNVWIISWKMVFLMVLLCKEAELPPRWRDGFNWAKRWLKSGQLLTRTHTPK